MLFIWGIGCDFEAFVKWDKPILDERVILIDSADNKIGTTIYGHIICPPSVIEKGTEEDCIFITSSKYASEIEKDIRKYNKKIKLINKMEALWRSKEATVHQLMLGEEKYDINIIGDIQNWIEQALKDECEYWEETIPKYIEENHEGLTKREFKYPFEWDLSITSEDIIIDVGSGPIPIFGNLVDGKEIDYRPLDPMAHQYKKLNRFFDVKVPVEPQFAIMELLTCFVPVQSVDYCIVHNAMDHSIDILRAFIECFRTVKIGGTMLMVHLASEGIHNNYDGLHQWNIDELNGELIFFNQKCKINISKMFAAEADIVVRREAIEIDKWNYRDWICCKIVKKCEPGELILQKYDNAQYISYLIEALFDKLRQE